VGRQEFESAVGVPARVPSEAPEQVRAGLVGVVHEEPDELRERAVGDEAPPDGRTRPRYCVVLLPEERVDGARLGGRVLAEFVGDRLVVVALRLGEARERLGSLVLACVGEVSEDARGGGFTGGRAFEDGIRGEVRARDGDQTLRGAQAVEFGLLRRLDRVREAVGVHAVVFVGGRRELLPPGAQLRGMSAPAISARELHERIREGGASVLDVRDRDEFELWHVDGPGVTADHVPYMEFVAAGVTGDAASLLPDDLREPLVVVCAVGEASAEVAEDLRREDVDAVNLAGGMAAWGDLVVAHDLGNSVVQFERPSSGCLSYLLADGGEAAVVDPLAAAVDEYVAAAEDSGASIEYAVDTHVHADHVSGVRALADATGAERVLPEGATDRGLSYDATLVGDGDELPVGQRALTVEHAPGHTTEQVTLAWGADLLTADCLFLDSVGRPDLESEDAARELAGRQYDTLQRLFDRDDDARVLPGHVEPSTARDGPDGGFARSLGEVRDGLSLLELDRGAFVDRVTTDLPPRPANDEEIVGVNLGRETLDDEALELERGPNNCAVSSVE